MSEWSKRERVTTEVVYTVRAPYPTGADWNQVQQALNAAIRDYNETHVSEGEPSDDSIRVYPRDDVIEIVFEKQVSTGE